MHSKKSCTHFQFIGKSRYTSNYYLSWQIQQKRRSDQLQDLNNW